MYKVPTAYILTHSLLVGEEARVTLKEKGRLKERKLLTLLTDGWEDILRRSVYGFLVAEVAMRPVVLGLSDLTGHRGTAEKLLEVLEHAMKKSGLDWSQIIALITDNPTVMKALRRLAMGSHPHIIVRLIRSSSTIVVENSDYS